MPKCQTATLPVDADGTRADGVSASPRGNVSPRARVQKLRIEELLPNSRICSPPQCYVGIFSKYKGGNALIRGPRNGDQLSPRNSWSPYHKSYRSGSHTFVTFSLPPKARFYPHQLDPPPRSETWTRAPQQAGRYNGRTAAHLRSLTERKRKQRQTFLKGRNG